MPQVIPGATPVYEGQSPLDGIVATCVEAAGAVITGIYGVMQATPATTRKLALDLQAKGLAGRGGATSSQALAPDLARLGIPSTWHGPSERGNFFSLINGALAQGKPILIGVTNASALQDAQTGQQPDLGVQNHGLTIVGADQYGYLVADPNTAPGSGFMTYSAANLQQAQLDTLLIPNDSPPGVQQASSAAFNAGAASASGGSGGGLTSLLSFNPGQVAQQMGQGLIAGVEGAIEDAAIRVGLIVLALILLVVGLIFFFTAGSGKGAASQAAGQYVGGYVRGRGAARGARGAAGSAGEAGESAAAGGASAGGGAAELAAAAAV